MFSALAVKVAVRRTRGYLRRHAFCRNRSPRWGLL